MKAIEDMTKEERIIEFVKTREYTYSEMRDTFLAGSRMLSDNHTSWREAFDKWMLIVAGIKPDDLDLS